MTATVVALVLLAGCGPVATEAPADEPAGTAPVDSAPIDTGPVGPARSSASPR